MKVEKNLLLPASQIKLDHHTLSEKADLALYFGNRLLIEDGAVFKLLRETYPQAIILGCSTGGEILDNDFYENSTTVVAIDFENTPIRASSTSIFQADKSFNAGVFLGKQLKADDLKAVFIISDGLSVDGSQLTHGLISVIGKKVPVTGGLAGDGADFGKTVVGLNDIPTKDQIIALGFYGDHIRFGHGSMGGWDIFGPKRVVTKSKGNVLYELDGKPALDLYKTYLGPLADKLPASALTLPMNIHPESDPETVVVRTVLAVDENEKSMTFAGTIPQGHIAQFLRGTVKNLVEGAEDAATQSISGVQDSSDSLAIMISCIGRKLLMGQRVVDEIEAVSEVFEGKPCTRIGFYSYGEISPHAYTGCCELHNQTMTITTLSEV